MLQIEHIKKTYVTGELTQTALNDVSLSFREHELVAILGPSGSGKSTLLNVIGGLDQYDSGDLIIDGISTKKYKDRDWDSYRNHSVGFIFQSYNLIPHQNVLSNVELALTISGIPASERKKRAVSALKNVGLDNQLHKKPNQMSGGQMQRVAIARALVNNPKILLADEPTGALDSETSIQVMELLKEVAKDRLVVMVTHNPELAEQYASRIVKVKDGKILSDSDPFTPNIQAQEPPKHKNMGRASMGFGSALLLSFQNLWTKKTRTLLTSFAGSIGIIGIALILSLSAGFQAYVDSIQRDTLANYPLSFQAETADMSSAFMSMMIPDEEDAEETPGTVLESPMLQRMFAHIGVNDLESFKKYIDDHWDQVSQMVNSIQYGYGLRPRIYAELPQEEEPFQVNPATLFKEITGNDGISAMMDVDAFHRLPEDRNMLSQQYEILQGKWPEKEDELVFILPMGGRIADQTAYTLGLKSMKHMDKMLEQMEDGLSPETDDPLLEWSYDDLMSLQYKWVPSPDFYRYNEEFQVWEDLSGEPEFLKNAVRDAFTLHVVGVIAPKEGSSPILMPGLGYTDLFMKKVIENAAESEIVKAQLADPDTDVFSGTKFDSDEMKKPPDFSSLISIDKNAIASSFGVNFSEDDFARMLKNSLQQVLDAAKVNTAPAQADFISSFKDLSHTMLKEAVDQGGGTVKITLSDADPMVTKFLAGNYAASKLKNLEKKYSVPADVFYSVYHPLMVGLISDFVAQDAIKPPDPPADPTEPTDFTDPTEVPADSTEPAQTPTEIPAESTEASTTPAEIPTEPAVSTDPTISSEPPADTVPQTEASSSEPTVPESSGSESTSPAAPPETQAPERQPLETRMPLPDPGTADPAESDGQTDPAAQASREPVLNLLTDIRFQDTSDRWPLRPPINPVPPAQPDPPAPDMPDSPNLPIPPVDSSHFYGVLTYDKIDPLVSSYSSLPMVTEAARITSLKMMESTAMRAAMKKLSGMDKVFSNFLQRSFYVDTNRLTNAFQFNMDEEKIQRLFQALMNGQEARSASSNLKKLDYADLDNPFTMNVYFKDFDSKEVFLEFLEEYNTSMRESDQEGKVIRYTDMTGRMMDSVRIIINSVSYVLIAFVGVSLVVSSIMIGIITYISVMERTREIGVLRAMGASKHNISQVFNAETFIIGLCSGLIGIGVTLAALIPGNRLLLQLTGNAQIHAQLPWVGAVILIILSMLLTLIGGLIPSRQAAKKDPVIALRSE